MGSSITIKKDENILLDSYIKLALNPKYIFLPLTKDTRLRVKDNSYVYKYDIVALKPSGMSIHSSISGTVLGIKDMPYVNGIYPSLVIENDFKENIRIRKSTKMYLGSYDKETILNMLVDNSLTSHNNYLYETMSKEYDTLIINAIEIEPYFGNVYFTLKDNSDDILEIIDLISDIFGYKETIFAIKTTESDLVTEIMNKIGTYPSITLKLVNDDYPNGIDNYLKKILNIKTNALILNIKDILNIYNILKKEVPITEQLITITGNAITPRCTLKVKKGSLLSEIFLDNFKFTKNLVTVYLNGMMHGEKINNLNYVIDDDLDGILVMEKKDYPLKECINCGFCEKNCPMGLNPKYVYDHKGKVKDEYKNTCLQCGLCNYICPANRDLRKFMKGDT